MTEIIFVKKGLLLTKQRIQLSCFDTQTAVLKMHNFTVHWFGYQKEITRKPSGNFPVNLYQ